MMLFDALITAIVVLISMSIWKKFRRPIIWVIDDNPIDTMMFKMNLQLDDNKFDVRYFSSVKGILWKTILTPPDAVICDYVLADNVNGDQVYDFFKRNHIPVIITTGYDGDIAGVGEIMKKSPERSYYEALENWVHKVTKRNSLLGH